MFIVSHMLTNAYCIILRILMSELISRREVESILSRTHRRERRLERRPILRAVRAACGRRLRRSGSCLSGRGSYAGQHQPDRRARREHDGHRRRRPAYRQRASRSRVITARLRGGGLRRAVVATDRASAHADYDNGARLHGSARWARDDVRATRCVDKELGDRVKSAPEAPHPAGRIFMHTAHIW
jgi:hypothetical protein